MKLPAPELVDTLAPEELPGFAAQANALAYRAALRLAATARAEAPAVEQLLTVEQAAQRLSVKVDWLRRQRALAFRVEVAPGTVRYSAPGLDRWVRDRMGK